MEVPHNPDVSWSLIARAAAGERGARSVFARGYLPVVRSFLEARWRSTRLAGEVDDAVQEVFIECLRENGVLSSADPERGDLRGLLYGVTRKVAARFEERVRKRHSRDQATGSMLDAVQAREPSLSIVFDREWARTLMRLTGDRMRANAEGGTPGARLRVELLRLRFAEGMPIRAIAAQWEQDPDAVHRAYAKARAEFKSCLREVVAEHAVRSEVDLDREVERVFELLG
ncbi:MAG: sigma-70 family RNA polymerase sigma factor [Planctomycetota bacterium]|nr:MAG: sigma-70 family RNA polymerase sigma factor [Planctomycetota bacterium]